MDNIIKQSIETKRKEREMVDIPLGKVDQASNVVNA